RRIFEFSEDDIRTNIDKARLSKKKDVRAHKYLIDHGDFAYPHLLRFMKSCDKLDEKRRLELVAKDIELESICSERRFLILQVIELVGTPAALQEISSLKVLTDSRLAEIQEGVLARMTGKIGVARK